MLNKIAFEWLGPNSHAMNWDSKNRAVEGSQSDVQTRPDQQEIRKSKKNEQKKVGNWKKQEI